MAYQSAAEAAQAVAKGETQFAVSHQSQIQETYQQGSVTVVCAFDEGPIENGPFAGVEGVGEYGYPYFRNRCFIMARAGTDEETVAELKALVILAILVVSYLLSRATDLFVVGAIFCCLGFLVYFRLFLPVTYTMTAIPGMMFLLGIYCAGGYGGSVSAILINTPGTPHAAATMLDGHPLSQQGRTKAALKIALYASTFGGVFSALMLLFLGPQVAKVAAQLGTAEYFMVCVFGLTISACWWASSRAPAPPRPPGSATTRPRTCPSTPRSSDTAPWRAWPPPSRPTTPSPAPPSSPCSPWASPATVPWPSCSPP